MVFPGLSAAPLLMAKKKLTLETTQSLPPMTADNLPAGHLVTYSSQNDSGSFAAKHVFDQSSATWWGTTYGGGLPQWVQRQVPAPILVGAVAITFNASVATNHQARPVDFTIQGSNGGAWTTLITVSGEAWAGGTIVRKVWDVAHPDMFDRYRMHITANGAGGAQLTSVAEIELLQLK